MSQPLPTDADGDLITSAEFGQAFMVQIEWNTDANNEPIGDGEPCPVTFHGPFDTEDEAKQWLEAYPDDTDIEEMTVIFLNRVRPKETP